MFSQSINSLKKPKKHTHIAHNGGMSAKPIEKSCTKQLKLQLTLTLTPARNPQPEEWGAIF